MKLLVDMNLAPRWCVALAEHGIEAVHWSEIGAGDATDEVIMRHARDHRYVVLTHDLDFGPSNAWLCHQIGVGWRVTPAIVTRTVAGGGGNPRLRHRNGVGWRG